MKKFLIVSTILFSSIAIAAGDAHGPSSLIPKFVNLSLVIIGLIYLCNVLDIDTRFIKLESNLVNHLLEEIRILIEEIKIINEMKN